jgi:hypothetical protein
MADPGIADLIRDLTRAATLVGEAMRPALQSSAAAIRDEWQNTWPWSGSRHLRLKGGGGPLLRIGFETTAGPFQAEAVIGVNRGDAGASQRAGKLGHLIEFGSVRNSPHPGGGPALARHAPAFAAEMALIGAALLGPGARAFGSSSVASRFNRRSSGDAWPGFES